MHTVHVYVKHIERWKITNNDTLRYNGVMLLWSLNHLRTCKTCVRILTLRVMYVHVYTCMNGVSTILLCVYSRALHSYHLWGQLQQLKLWVCPNSDVESCVQSYSTGIPSWEWGMVVLFLMWSLCRRWLVSGMLWVYRGTHHRNSLEWEIAVLLPSSFCKLGFYPIIRTVSTTYMRMYVHVCQA